MHVHRKLEIEATPAQVWRCLTEPELLKRWISNMVDETPDDPNKTTGVGAASTMQLREGPKIGTYRSVVTEWELHRRVAVRISGGMFVDGMNMDVAYALAARGGNGTLLDYDVRVPLKGKFKLMAPLMWLMSLVSVKKDLSKLQALAPTIEA